ncbi:hypothetical protein MYCTH_40928 [Thermothelomyces thermophilus ATCC 42464]|uniref:Uncharacterized protein n=1 Tax=Thermothelomyces thermophilus (strain ATCC 42464 / BCRC 31852 / DSM 1799) TaxID=573729 RepID=G2Q0P3_THET4|nr:uncharacterized protein MYCTH_40928 [Thermothelomyces thermophilus ATCC 42464]AEO54905.1 hypothetical protein MYCTH_40928 [Thermothelomyces thermophilus ATCC 42464]
MSTFDCPSIAATLSTQEHASEFDVTVEFLLQMASYLTERHTSQLRAHMLKAAAARGSNAPSPVPGAEPQGNSQFGVNPARRASLGTGRAPSALSNRKETATPLGRRGEEPSGGAAGPVPTAKNAYPIRPGSALNSPAHTAAPYAALQDQPGSRPGTATRPNDPTRRRFPHLPTPSIDQRAQQPQPQRLQQPDRAEMAPPSPAASSCSSSSSSSSCSSSSSDSHVESRIVRRPPRFQKPPKGSRGGGNGPFVGGGGGNDDDDDDDDEPAFAPFTQQGAASSSGQDLGATLRGNNMDLRDLAGRGRPVLAASTISSSSSAAAAAAAAVVAVADDTSQSHSQTSLDSSIGSSSAPAVLPRRPATTGPGDGRRVLPTTTTTGAGGPLSPRRPTELAGARGARAKGTSREGSDGTPSMGSSFSDLDDASVTQSALEEALASRMQDGTIGSRMSVIGGTIGQAFRSRYLPKPNRQ